MAQSEVVGLCHAPMMFAIPVYIAQRQGLDLIVGPVQLALQAGTHLVILSITH